MFCTRCGADNPDGGRYCVSCGSALQSSEGSPAAAGTLIAGTAANNQAAASETSGKAIASLICGVFFFFFPTAIVAIVLGHLALSDIRKQAGRLKGHGVAVAGLVLGYSGALVIPFILIIAAIAIPNLIRARMAANEASAVGSLQTIEAAAITYRARYGNGFPPDLAALGNDGSGAANCNGSLLIDQELASGTKDGYLFTYEPGPQYGYSIIVSPRAQAEGCRVPGGLTFDLRADPLRRGTTGQRSFYVDNSGIIRYERLRPAASDSPPVN
jgi:type IV pilus assembly protein PilA